jgi:hypothetical protein
LFDVEARERLPEVKAKWDPDGVFRANFAVGVA